MSKMTTTYRKPPLAKSPIRLHPRRSNSTTSIHTPAPGESKKTFSWEEGGLLRPEYRSISCELQALAKMVHQELGNPSRLGGGGGGSMRAPPPPSGGFERGRFYEEYSARRKERLNNKRRKSNSSSSSSSSYNKLGRDKNGDACFKTPASKIAGLGVTSTNNKKKTSLPSAAYDYCYSSMEEEGLTLTLTTTNNTTTKSTAPAPRYMLRSMSKENRKPPAPPNLVNSVLASGVRRTRPF